LTPFYVGLVFGLKDGANAAASPIWGYLCDRNPQHNKWIIVITASLGALSFIVLGPFPGLPITE
jgi:MFS family permease